MSSGAPPKTISVLLVEDSPLDGRLLLEAIRSSMKAGEVVVQSVKTLAAAKAELQKFSFSCVLLDLGLPDGRGTGNVSALRAIDKTAAIIVLTGLDDERSATESLKLGAQDYLIKGETDGEKLMKLIRHAVQRNRQTNQLEVQRDSTFFDASHDRVTLLPNRSLFLDRAQMLLASSRLQDSNFGLAYLVVEGIDAAKAQYGAGVADELVQRIAQVMSETLRSSDTLARVEFSEFALMLQPSANAATLAARAELMRDRVENLRSVGNCSVELKLKFGIALRHADESMEHLYDQAQRDSKLAKATLTAAPSADAAVAEMLPAVAADGLQMIAKWLPWADIGSGRCLGLSFAPEWADGAPLLQTQTLSMTEAVELTLSSAQAMASQWRDWKAAGLNPPLVALKLPAAALRSTDFVPQLRALLEGFGLPANLVQLEIEESAFKDGGSYLEALTALHGMGYLLCMDGDGSADMALSDMVRVPVGSYKLSHSFLTMLLEEGLQGPSRRFLMAVLGAAQALGATLVAGSVDTREALTALQLVGVPLMQGQAISPLLTSEAAPAVWNTTLKLA